MKLVLVDPESGDKVTVTLSEDISDTLRSAMYKLAGGIEPTMLRVTMPDGQVFVGVPHVEY